MYDLQLTHFSGMFSWCQLENQMKVSLNCVNWRSCKTLCWKRMHFSYHFQKKCNLIFQSCLKLQQNHNWGNITSFFLFYTIYKTLLNYVQDVRFSRPENYIIFLGWHTKIYVLMSSKNNIVELTSSYFSLCFECQNGLWDFQG